MRYGQAWSQVAGALAITVLVTGCSSAEEPIEPVPVSELAANGRSQQMVLSGAYLLQPAGDRYDPGSTAVVVFELRNTGGMEQRLVGVDSSVARSGTLRWDRDCDAVAEVAPAIPFPAEPSDEEQLPTDYYAELVGFYEQVSDDVRVPVTFEFAGIPPIEVSLPVAERPTPNERWLCLPAAG